MALTLAESAKLSQDMLLTGVIETIEITADAIHVTTNRGTFASTDRGRNWSARERREL